MNKLKTIGISALAGSMALTSANAVDWAVTGDAIVTYSSQTEAAGTEAESGRGIGVDTDLAFNASGELDNGYTISFFQAANTNTTWSNSSSQVTLGMGSLGTLQVNNAAGSKANGIDDVMPAAYEETWDSLSPDNPSFFGDATGSGSIDYRLPAIEASGVTMNIAITYDPAANAAAPTEGGVSATSYSGHAAVIEMSHESGLSFGAGIEQLDDGGLAAGAGTSGDTERVTGYVKYAMGGLSVGYQEAYNNPVHRQGVEGADQDATFMGIAYTSGDLSFSYAESTLDSKATSDANLAEIELDSIQAAYSMGAMTVSAARTETSNTGGAAGESAEETQVSVSFAF
jgi:hypothetical protein